ncbi:glycosyltransferase [Azospirillum sp. SYSU D00513]|uniref:glycosyltransferase n=1 Tax=Azospirillum sp. SYSU D00513 TaxID=2812561 RepID=UPI001A967DAB|nr:glycosyltransferase [Azospirillum sp. SYSU D00513]
MAYAFWFYLNAADQYGFDAEVMGYDRLNAQFKTTIAGCHLTKFMYLFWSVHPEIQSHFDISTEQGRAAFLFWYWTTGAQLYKIPKPLHATDYANCSLQREPETEAIPLSMVMYCFWRGQVNDNATASRTKIIFEFVKHAFSRTPPLTHLLPVKGLMQPYCGKWNEVEGDCELNRMLAIVWSCHPNLQTNFNIGEPEGRYRFLVWCMNQKNDYPWLKHFVPWKELLRPPGATAHPAAPGESVFLRLMLKHQDAVRELASSASEAADGDAARRTMAFLEGIIATDSLPKMLLPWPALVTRSEGLPGIVEAVRTGQDGVSVIVPAPQASVAHKAIWFFTDAGVRNQLPDNLIPWSVANEIAAERQVIVYSHSVSLFLTRFMLWLWESRADLQTAFSIGEPCDAAKYMLWFVTDGAASLGLDPRLLPTDLLNTPTGVPLQESGTRVPLLAWLLASQSPDMPADAALESVKGWRWLLAPWVAHLSLPAPLASGLDLLREAVRADDASEAGRSGIRPISPSATLIGYARAESGMGQHMRMSMRAFQQSGIEHSVVNISAAGHHQRDTSVDQWLVQEKHEHPCAILHINADQMLHSLGALGTDFFKDRYIIGYWLWELAEFPEAFDISIDLVDEIWAPSRFIFDAIRRRTTKPVTYIPLPVQIDPPDEQSARLTRGHFGLPEDSYCYFFAFDWKSFITRKNPFACIEAFKRAFPTGKEKACLVLKSMDADASNPVWQALAAAAAEDPRIHLFDQVLRRNEIVRLIELCDCYLSLHRAEGFGFGPAEAMLLGKPVIVTDYSATKDFCLAWNARLVRTDLVGVGPGEYPFGKGQSWADPDVDHAAWHMRDLYYNPGCGAELGRHAQRFICEQFNPQTIGRMVRARMQALAQTVLNSDAPSRVGVISSR